MKAIVGHLCHVAMVAALALTLLGGLGRSIPELTGMTGGTLGQFASHASATMPMDHAAIDGTSDADMAACDLQCLSLAVVLPVSPTGKRLLPRARRAEVSVLLLPAPHASGPDGPPPKYLAL